MPAPGMPTDVRVETTLNAGVANVVARANLCTPLGLIWETLTDYEHLSDFIPGLRSSKVMERDEDGVRVAQEGSTGILFFRHDIHVVLQSTEKPPYVIGVHLISGNLRQLEGHYRIEPLDDTGSCFRLNWVGVIEPDGFMPAFLVLPILRTDLKRQFTGMVAEIVRRTLTPPATRPTPGS